jgi:threonine/homoserine/homoserine lactone efflux protein
MKRRFNNGPSGIGIGIFYLILICVPFLGWVFNLLDWILEHILWFIGLGIVWFFVNVWNDFKSLEKEKENV